MSGDIIFWPWFALPDDQWCWASFHVPAGHLYVIFGKIFISFANFYFCCTPWNVGSYFFDQILSQHPLHKKCGVLATEPPGTSPFVHFSTELFILLILNYMSTLHILNIKIYYYNNANFYIACKCFINQQAVFSFVDSFLHCSKAFWSNIVLFVYFCFCCLWLQTQFWKSIAETDVI